MHTKHIRTADTDFKPNEAEIDASIARGRGEAERQEAEWELACPSDPCPGTQDDDDEQQTVLRAPPASSEELEADEWILARDERAAAVARIRARREARRKNEDAAQAAREQKAQVASDACVNRTAPRARARRSPSRRGTVRRGTGGGGDGGGDDGDPEPPHSNYDIFDYSRLAARWNCSPRSLANQFSSRPDSLPPHINLPGTRGPRWLREDVQEFERCRRQIPDQPKRPRGRPRVGGGRA